MARKTIDGLIVHSHANSMNKSPKKQQSVKRAALVDTKKANIKAAKVSPDKPSVTSKAARDDFLQPVKSLELGKTSEERELGATSEADWSDLLDQINKPKKEAGDRPKTEGNSSDWINEDDLKDTKKDKRAKKAAKKQQKGGRKHRLRRVILIIILLLLVAAAWVAFVWGDSIISRLTNGNSGLWDTFVAMVSEEIPFETDENGRTNVIVFGTEGYDMDGTVDGGTHDGAQLTDSIMVVSFDQETKDVALISLPRDLKVSMACSAGKINEVFWCHNQDGSNEEAGAQALMEQAEEIFGIDFQYWAHVNWASLIDIVDTLGGITVTFDEDISDQYYTGAVAKAGVPITLNGEQALAFARARHGTTGGDFTRGHTQQKIVEAILQKVLDNGVGVTEALGLFNILGDNLRTNFSADNIKTGVSLISGFSMDNIRQVPLIDYENNVYYLTTGYINNISYVIPTAGANNYKEIQTYIKQMLANDPVVREGATIAVYNGTEAYGVAGAERDALEEVGFTVETVGDAETGSCTTQYCLYVLNDEMTATRAALEERYGVTAQSSDVLPSSIWPGQVDFVVIIGIAPSTATEESSN